MSPQSRSYDDTPDYLATLGLDRAPFLDQADDSFFYADPVLMQRLDLLQHLTQFGDMLLGVLGPSGSGKTTLLQQFLLRRSNHWRVCRIDATHTQTPEEIFNHLAETLGVEASGDSDRTRAAVLRQIQNLHHNAQLAVLLIDNADQLTDNTLASLLGLADNPKQTLKLLRIILFATPALETRLLESGLHSPQQPLLHKLDIPPFDEQQTAAYLMYRLAVAGYSGDSPFSLTEIRAMHKSTQGLPGRLNLLAHETLMERATRIAARHKAGEDNPAPPRPTSQRPLVLGSALVGLLLVAAAFYWLPSQDTDLPPPPASAELESLTEPQEQLAQADTDPTTSPEIEPDNTLESSVNNRLALDNTDEKSAPEIDSMAAEEPELESPGGPHTAIPTAVSDVSPVESTSEQTTQRATESADEPTSEDIPSSEPDEHKPAASSAAPPVAQPVVAAPEPPSAPPAPRPPTPESANTPADVQREAWLESRPAEHFTLQILGVRDEASLLGYLRRSNLPAPVAYFRTKYKGEDWWVLVQGDYADKTAARAGIDKLPTKVRQAKPWPRSFATVQADIDKVSTSGSP